MICGPSHGCSPLPCKQVGTNSAENPLRHRCPRRVQSVSLPSATSSPRADRTDERADPRTSSSGGNWILFIEDRPDDSELYAERLQAVGLNVITAPTGAQGVAKAVSLQPSIVVLDLMLPDVDGWDVCEQLRKEPRTSEIPIVILTARFERGLRQRAHELGCAGYLTKPCDIHSLTTEIRRVLGTA